MIFMLLGAQLSGTVTVPSSSSSYVLRWANDMISNATYDTLGGVKAETGRTAESYRVWNSAPETSCYER